MWVRPLKGRKHPQALTRSLLCTCHNAGETVEGSIRGAKGVMEAQGLPHEHLPGPQQLEKRFPTLAAKEGQVSWGMTVCMADFRRGVPQGGMGQKWRATDGQGGKLMATDSPAKGSAGLVHPCAVTSSSSS